LIAIDTNILVYAHRGDLPAHATAKSVVARLAEGSHPWAIPWPCVHEFYSVVTNPRIFRNDTATPPELALMQIEAWMGSPTLQLLAETQRYYDALKKVLSSSNVRGALVHDARVFALCEEHGVAELWTADRDFSRFAGDLKLWNPLTEPCN